MRQEAEEETHKSTEQKWGQSQMRYSRGQDGFTDKWAITGIKSQVMANNLATSRFQNQKNFS